MSNNPKPPSFSIEELRRTFRYDPETGALYWRISPNNHVPAGAQAGNINNRGYLAVGFRGRSHQAHHIIWALLYGAWPTRQIDHDDRNRTNNRQNNLKVARGREQNLNRVTPNRTGYKGVTKIGQGKYRGSLRVGESMSHLGTFRTAREAALAFDTVAATPQVYSPTNN